MEENRRTTWEGRKKTEWALKLRTGWWEYVGSRKARGKTGEGDCGRKGTCARENEAFCKNPFDIHQ